MELKDIKVGDELNWNDIGKKTGQDIDDGRYVVFISNDKRNIAYHCVVLDNDIWRVNPRIRVLAIFVETKESKEANKFVPSKE